jgi:hypothetical protein
MLIITARTILYHLHVLNTVHNVHNVHLWRYYDVMLVT